MWVVEAFVSLKKLFCVGGRQLKLYLETMDVKMPARGLLMKGTFTTVN